MLGKLLKYEMKAGLRLLPIVYLGMVSVFLVGLLAKAIGISQIQFAAALLLAVGGVAAVLMTLVLVILRCFKGLFGTEGYLTQTLPVGKGTLLLSKVIGGLCLDACQCARGGGRVCGLPLGSAALISGRSGRWCSAVEPGAGARCCSMWRRWEPPNC